MNSRDHQTPKLKRKKYLPLLHQYALQFNGTDEYLTRALPTNILTGTANDFVSAGTMPAGFSASGATWNQTGITGSTSTNVVKLTGTNAFIMYTGLTVGKKYKLRVRWYGDNSLRIGSTSTGAEYYTSAATSQWNRKEITFTATSANIYFSIASGTVYIDFFNITEDWKLDLNESYELIKHSINRDFEQTLVTTYASNFSAGVDGWANYINTSVAGNIDNISGENDCLEVTVTNSASTPRIQKNISGLANGKRYVLKFRTFTNSAASVPYQVYTGNVQQTILTATKISNMWQTHEVGFLCTGTDGSGLLEINFTGSTSDKWYLKDFIIQEIPNLFTNGTFVDGTNWLREEPATQTFADGVCHFVNTTLNYSIYADAVNRKLINGKRYRLSFQILNYVSGGLKVTGAMDPSSAFTSNGVHTYNFTYNGTNGLFYISATATGTTLDLDNIHIYELPDYVTAGNHTASISIADKYAGTGSLKITASGAGDSGSNYVSLPSAQIDTLVSGNKYTYEFFPKTDPTSLTYTNNATLSTNCSATGSWKAERGTLAVEDGMFKYTVNNSTSTPKGLVYTNGMSNTKIYRIRFKAKSPTITSNLQFVGGISGAYSQLNIKNPNLSTDFQDYEVYAYTSVVSDMYIASGQSGNLEGQIIYFDDIVIDDVTAPIITAQIGTKSVTVTPNITSTWTKAVLNFEAGASELNQDIKFYLNGAGSVYVDNVSLTQRYDWVAVFGAKNNAVLESGAGSIGCVFGTYITTGERLSFQYDNRVANKFAIFYVGGTTNGTYLSRPYASSSLQTNYIAMLYYDTIVNTAKMAVGINGNLTYGNHTLGKLYINSTFEIGKWSNEYWNGLIAPIQILRFTNISQSNFDPTTYKPGYPIPGGGAEIVLWYDPKNGSNIANMLQDYSGAGNNLSAVNIDLTNRVLVRKS